MSTQINISKPIQLEVNTTPITSGTVGRVLFQGTGNVLQQSANISWDNTNVAFFLGSVATRTLIFRPQATSGAFGNSSLIGGGNGNGRLDFYSATNITQLTDNVVVLTSVGGPSIQVGVSSIALNVAGATQLAVAATTGNIVIGGGADAGFRLDVNGTARASAYHTNFGTNAINLITSGQTPQSSDRGIFIGNGTFTAGIVNLGIGNSINIGSGNGNVAIGFAANASGGSIAITRGITGAVAASGGIAIGGNAGASGVAINGTAIGNAVAVGVGTNAASSGSIAIGSNAVANANISMAVGDRANSNHNFSIALGLGSKTLAANDFVAGGYFAPGSYGIYNVYFGSGPQGDQVNTINGESYTIHGSGGFGTNQNGGNITIAGGKGTGSGTPGSIGFSTAVIGASGTTLQSLTSRMLIFGSTGNVGINTTTDAGFRLDVNGDTIFRRITNVTPNTITGGTQFFTVKSGNWPTALIRCFENGNINLGSPTGNIGFDSTSFILPVSSTFNFNYLPANQLNTFAFILSANYTNVGAGGTSEGTMLRTSGSTSTSVGTVTMNQIESKPTYNNTGGTTINRGFYYNPILSSMTNTTHYAIHSTSGRVRLEGLPTSSTGLSAGDIWNDGGTLKIV